MTLFAEQPRLLPAYRAGERDALEAVYWRYVSIVERVVRFGFQLTDKQQRIAGAQGDAVAEVVQEVFARAFSQNARLAYDGLRPFAPYLVQIARNLLVDRARKSGRELSFEASSTELADKMIAQPLETADDFADAETVALTEKYIAGLPEDLRAVHEQRFVIGLSQRDAAQQLGISRQQLRTREARLCDGLRTLVRERGRR
jgi:RNA polymerase sigma-70 factor, ECF subfamily